MISMVAVAFVVAARTPLFGMPTVIERANAPPPPPPPPYVPIIATSRQWRTGGAVPPQHQYAIVSDRTYAPGDFLDVHVHNYAVVHNPPIGSYGYNVVYNSSVVEFVEVLVTNPNLDSPLIFLRYDVVHTHWVHVAALQTPRPANDDDLNGEFEYGVVRFRIHPDVPRGLLNTNIFVSMIYLSNHWHTPSIVRVGARFEVPLGIMSSYDGRITSSVSASWTGPAGDPTNRQSGSSCRYSPYDRDLIMPCETSLHREEPTDMNSCVCLSVYNCSYANEHYRATAEYLRAYSPGFRLCESQTLLEERLLPSKYRIHVRVA